MSKSGFLSSSITRKVAMSLSAIFLMVFLAQHFAINVTSIWRPATYNKLAHFMGTNFLIQYIMQPVLLFGVLFHFIMGFVLEIRNRSSRAIKYVKNNGNANSTWMSRNMILSGIVILLFFGLHFYDFWIPEIKTKFINGDWTGMVEGEPGYRYWIELHYKFVDPVRVGIYCVAFIFLSLHLLHGFNSSLQSLGQNNKYTRGIRNLGFAFATLIPAGFIAIALVHHFIQ